MLLQGEGTVTELEASVDLANAAGAQHLVLSHLPYDTHAQTEDMVRYTMQTAVGLPLLPKLA